MLADYYPGSTTKTEQEKPKAKAHQLTIHSSFLAHILYLCLYLFIF